MKYTTGFLCVLLYASLLFSGCEKTEADIRKPVAIPQREIEMILEQSLGAGTNGLARALSGIPQHLGESGIYNGMYGCGVPASFYGQLKGTDYAYGTDEQYIVRCRGGIPELINVDYSSDGSFVRANRSAQGEKISGYWNITGLESGAMALVVSGTYYRSGRHFDALSGADYSAEVGISFKDVFLERSSGRILAGLAQARIRAASGTESEGAFYDYPASVGFVSGGLAGIAILDKNYVMDLYQ